MTLLEPTNLSSDELLFDPNNYRFQDNEGYVPAAEDRFHENNAQARAYDRLRKDEGILDLKRSITRNGYVPIERIVVRPYQHSEEEKYVVIEGNRRLAAVRWALEDYDSGYNIGESVRESLQALPVIVAEIEEPDEIFRASLMGIRHVGGIKEWGGYQRAKLIVSMRDDLSLEAAEIAERLGLSTQEVNRRYRAFKALQQMQNDEEYGGYAIASMYPIFHEAVSLPIVRDEWFGWDANESRFENEDNLYTFYSLITPASDEEGEDGARKITTYAQVRELRSILPKPEAKRVLLDPHRSFQEAVNIARQDELRHMWATDVSAAISSLEAMGIQELKHLSDEDIELLQRLSALADERVGDYNLLARR